MDYRLELICVPVSEIEDLPWGRFVYFKDPDGNAWNIQQGVPASPSSD